MEAPEMRAVMDLCLASHETLKAGRALLDAILKQGAAEEALIKIALGQIGEGEAEVLRSRFRVVGQGQGPEGPRSLP